MAPRLPTSWVLNFCLRPPPPTKPVPSSLLLPVVQTANVSWKEAKERARLDPYGWAQAQQRKAANQQRQKELQEIRSAGWGDPVRGADTLTPYVESFDSTGQAAESEPIRDEEGHVVTAPRPLPTSTHMLNHMLNRDELEEHLAYAKALSKPFRISADGEDSAGADDGNLKRTRKWEMDHNRASDAIRRIMTLGNAGGKMRRHANIRRCVEDFGRHNTDKVFWRRKFPPGAGESYGPYGELASGSDGGPVPAVEGGEGGEGGGDGTAREAASPTSQNGRDHTLTNGAPAPATAAAAAAAGGGVTAAEDGTTASDAGDGESPTKRHWWEFDPEYDAIRANRRKRAGPDTGSSEVQIAILTMKIRRLSVELGRAKGHKDKANKRNLRLLVHRRQKLLNYMWRREKNSARWANMIEKLGLSPATWQGEIVV